MSQDLVLITGSTGTVGTEVIRQWVAAGVPVRAAYNSDRSRSKLEAMGVAETVQLDMSDRASLAAAFQGITKAFLLVPFTPTILEQGTALIDAAKEAGIQYVVRLSALGANANAEILPGQWHGQLDNYLRASGIPFTIIQPNFFMQNFVTFYGDMIKQQNALFIPYGDAAVSWVDVRDIGTVVAACLQNPLDHSGKTYVLTGSDSLTTDAIATQLSQVLQRPITYHDIPEEAAVTAMQQQGMPDMMVQALADLNHIARAGYAAAVSPDIETVTGKPATSFSQFIHDYESAWR